MPAPVPARSTFGTHLQALLKDNLSNWKISLSQSQLIAFVAHIEQQVVTDSATVIADATADLLVWLEPAKGHHT